ncbi:MAG: dUTP diphosphatase [Cellulomonadaceae bacterium]|jgi:dUTP pyrophosphatase|nr:dUTP diphosphatase [Cellulomonadaceae bacterium]
MQNPVEILIQKLNPNAQIPAYAHPGDAGADLVSTIDCEIPPLTRAMIPTGLAIALPAGYAAFVHPRSGLAAKQGVTTLNAPGTIDAGYRGEIQVILYNSDPETKASIKRGDRIAQLVIQEVAKARFIEAERLPGSDRGQGGFGSTGVGSVGVGSTKLGAGADVAPKPTPEKRPTRAA